MDLEDLLCAACGGRVAEARCATCRAALHRLRAEQPRLPTGPVLLAACVLLLLVLALL
ncbi:MAG: hypothetical protein JWL64_407 [Frankiales bacterium]|nr:hypothetical protein [Frankiales bacterium]